MPGEDTRPRTPRPRRTGSAERRHSQVAVRPRRPTEPNCIMREVESMSSHDLLPTFQALGQKPHADIPSRSGFKLYRPGQLLGIVRDRSNHLGRRLSSSRTLWTSSSSSPAMSISSTMSMRRPPRSISDTTDCTTPSRAARSDCVIPAFLRASTRSSRRRSCRGEWIVLGIRPGRRVIETSRPTRPSIGIAKNSITRYRGSWPRGHPQRRLWAGGRRAGEVP